MDIIDKIIIFSSKLTIQYIHREEGTALDSDRLLDLKNLFSKVYISKGIEEGWRDYHKIKIDTGDFPDIIITDIHLNNDSTSTLQKIFIENSHQIVISISKFLKKEELENYIDLGISYMLLEPIDIAQFNLVIGRASEFIYHRKWEKKHRQDMNRRIEELKHEIVKFSQEKDKVISLLISELWKEDDEVKDDSSIENLKLIDYSEGLQRMGGDKDLYEELLIGFCTYYDTCVIDMKKAFMLRDIKRVGELAHSVKGAAGNISAKSIYNIIVDLENVIRDEKDEVKIFILITKFERVFKALCSSLKKLIK